MTKLDKNANDKKLDWAHLEDLPDAELATVVESAIFVLKQSAVPGQPSPGDMPPGQMVNALEQLFNERGVEKKAADRIVKHPELSRPLAIAILSSIATEPVLAEEITRVWRERQELLVVGTGMILASALLFLVLKLRKVKAGKNGVEIDFDKLSNNAIGRVFAFLS